MLPLPPYSSDYTPIEELWSKAKQYLRRAAARSRGTLYDALGEALEHVTAKDILGWFQHAGLCATLMANRVRDDAAEGSRNTALLLKCVSSSRGDGPPLR